jgi:hypothetical protein
MAVLVRKAQRVRIAVGGVAAQFCQRQGAEERSVSRVRIRRAREPAAAALTENWIMKEDWDAVPAEVDICFNACHAEVEGNLKGRQRILRL